MAVSAGRIRIKFLFASNESVSKIPKSEKRRQIGGRVDLQDQSNGRITGSGWRKDQGLWFDSSGIGGARRRVQVAGSGRNLMGWQKLKVMLTDLEVRAQNQATKPAECEHSSWIRLLENMVKPSKLEIVRKVKFMPNLQGCDKICSMTNLFEKRTITGSINCYNRINMTSSHPCSEEFCPLLDRQLYVDTV